MNDEITKITSLTGLIDQAQLSEIVSEICQFYSGKIAMLEQQIKDIGSPETAEKLANLEQEVAALKKRNVYILADEPVTEA